jgi:hypothetical protein
VRESVGNDHFERSALDLEAGRQIQRVLFDKDSPNLMDPSNQGDDIGVGYTLVDCCRRRSRSSRKGSQPLTATQRAWRTYFDPAAARTVIQTADELDDGLARYLLEVELTSGMPVQLFNTFADEQQQRDEVDTRDTLRTMLGNLDALTAKNGNRLGVTIVTGEPEHIGCEGQV